MLSALFKHILSFFNTLCKVTAGLSLVGMLGNCKFPASRSLCSGIALKPHLFTKKSQTIFCVPQISDLRDIAYRTEAKISGRTIFAECRFCREAAYFYLFSKVYTL